MDRDNAVGFLVIAYIAVAAGYIGWRLGRSFLLRDQELSRLRSDLWDVQAKERAAAAAAGKEVTDAAAG